MERYIVSARKYRPQTFESVVGQRHITSTLENALQNNHLAQAMLFCGPRGVGKTTCARILAKNINESDQVSEEDFAFNIFELDAASNNSVDDIRRLIDQVRFAPQVGRFKVYIIDEVHMLSASAFNAFLKTLEEPPPHAIFILATTEKHKIIPTILSRCQIFDFKRITVDDIAEHLAYVARQEGISADREALHIIAQKADGALRDALSLFDRLVSYSGNTITYEGVIANLNFLDYEYYFKATDLLLAQDLTGLLLLFNEILDKGFEGIQFANGLATHLRDLMVSLDPQTIALLEVGPGIKQRYFEQSKKCPLPFIIGALRVLNDCDVRYKNTTNQRLLVEVSLLEILKLLEKKSPEVATEPRAIAKTEVAQKPQPVQKITIEAGVSTPPPMHEAPKQPPLPTPEPVAKTIVSETPPPTAKTETLPATPSPLQKPAISTETQNQPDWMQRARGRSISIKTDIERSAAEVQTEASAHQDEEQKGPQEVFSTPAFEQAWREFLNHIVHRKSIHGMLVAHSPELKNLTEVHFTLANNTQVGYLQNVKQELLQFLREKLNNYAISLHSQIAETTTEKRPYTGEEHYKAMLEINPLLDKLRKAFEAELE